MKAMTGEGGVVVKSSTSKPCLSYAALYMKTACVLLSLANISGSLYTSTAARRSANTSVLYELPQRPVLQFQQSVQTRQIRLYHMFDVPAFSLHRHV